MAGGVLLVSRDVKLFPYYKKRLEQLGFLNVHVTGEEKDSLNMVINELKPQMVLIGSSFYDAATPYMMGQLLKSFPNLNIAAINVHRFPDRLAPYFIWFGVKSYVNIQEGLDEFYFGLQEVRQGHSYIAPHIRELIENCEWPELNDKEDRRQLEVLIFLCNGIKPQEIGEKLQVSKRTVEWHIEELFKVFGVHSRETLISMAFYLDVVTKDDLRFFDRKVVKARPLPKWTVIKKMCNEQIRIGS
jgi:DNA-binding NarL/FixJ family response regulator